MSDPKDEEVIILPSLMSYRDTAPHGFVPPSVSAIGNKAIRRRRKLITSTAAVVALIGVSTVLLVQAVPRLGSGGAVGASSAPTTWRAGADQIAEIVNFRDGGMPLSQGHDWAPQTYPQSPPIGGKHSPVWQQCMGNIYQAPIANEHAVHSLEHGAVWLAYRPDLTVTEVGVLQSKIENKSYTLMAPYEGLDAKVSLQAWGYQLKVDDVNDPRIDVFITMLAKNAAVEVEASCTGGNTATGTTPLSEQQAMERLTGK